LNDPGEIRRALEGAETVAVVGCSANPARPSHVIARYLRDSGYRVVPVNPGHPEILGEECYGSLSEIPPQVRVDIVDVFRRSSAVGPVADEAIARGVGFFFMQQGIVNREAARRLEDAGIPVAMDRCILVERESLLAGLSSGARGTDRGESSME
jgi:predicted CoA-binding protein